MPTSCFLIEPTSRYRRRLRRYTSGGINGEGRPCPNAFRGSSGHQYGHDAAVILDAIEADEHPISGDSWPHDDERWPIVCEACGASFEEDDTWQLFVEKLYLCDDGSEYTLRDVPPGAMWYATWLEDRKAHDCTPECQPHWVWFGPDGRILTVKTPGGDWIIDSRASNCTMPEDNEHRCWVRHGDPPNVTVDKNGKTCNAGGGSIGCGSYHGFLQDGALT